MKKNEFDQELFEAFRRSMEHPGKRMKEKYTVIKKNCKIFIEIDDTEAQKVLLEVYDPTKFSKNDKKLHIKKEFSLCEFIGLLKKFKQLDQDRFFENFYLDPGEWVIYEFPNFTIARTSATFGNEDELTEEDYGQYILTYDDEVFCFPYYEFKEISRALEGFLHASLDRYLEEIEENRKENIDDTCLEFNHCLTEIREALFEIRRNSGNGHWTGFSIGGVNESN